MRTPGQRSRIPSASVFDPVLDFATFTGGQGGFSNAGAFLVDSAGNSFIAGTIGSMFPTTPGVIDPTGPTAGPVGLYKVDPTGQSIIFATHLPGLSEVDGMAFDSAGDIYVAGISLCPTPVDCPSINMLTFPTGVTPYQSSPRSIAILKLNSTATSLLAATYLGGSSQEVPRGIASDADGNLYVTGYTSSNDFPTLNPLQGSLGAGKQNVFVTKINPTLSALEYSTYLGQDSPSFGYSIAVDASQDAYVAGTFNLATNGNANNLPTTQNAFNTSCTGNVGCGFLSELSPAGSSLLYSTYAGVSANAVAVDAHGNAFIGGVAQSPTSFSQTLSPCVAQGNDSFVAEISSSGALSFSTCLGGGVNPITGVTHLTLDSSGNVYAVGAGAAGMTLKNPIQGQIVAASSFVAAINPSSPAMIFASYFGGTDVNDVPASVGVDSAGNIYVAGTDTAGFGAPPLTIFPVFNAVTPVVNTSGCGTHIACNLSSAFLLKIAPTDAPAAAVSPGGLTFGVQALGEFASQTVTVFDEGSSPLVISDIAATGDFQVPMNNPCQTTIPAAGGSCVINVSFAPTAFGTRTGTLTLTDNSAGSPHTVQLTGTGGQGTASLSPTSLTFDNQAVGTTSAPQTVTLTDPGALSLQILHIGISGPFSETNNCGTSLGSTSSCTITVTFAPTTAGAATGAITFLDSAPDSPQTVMLNGTGGSGSGGGGTGGGGGTPPSIGLGVAMGGSASSTVAAGASTTYSLSIGGAGVAGTATLTCTGAPSGATCSVPATVPIDKSTPSTFKATITTTARSSLLSYRDGPATWLGTVAVLLFLVLLQTAFASHSLRPRWRFAPMLAIAMCACGGGNSSPPPSNTGTPAGSYTISVTAQSGTTTATQKLTLVVQ